MSQEERDHNRLSDEDTVKLNAWLHDLEEHQLAEPDRKALETMLLGSELARRYLVQRLGMGAALCRLADESQESGDQEGDSPQGLRAHVSTASLGGVRTPGALRRAWPAIKKVTLLRDCVLM